MTFHLPPYVSFAGERFNYRGVSFSRQEMMVLEIMDDFGVDSYQALTVLLDYDVAPFGIYVRFNPYTGWMDPFGQALNTFDGPTQAMLLAHSDTQYTYRLYRVCNTCAHVSRVGSIAWDPSMGPFNGTQGVEELDFISSYTLGRLCQGCGHWIARLQLPPRCPLNPIFQRFRDWAYDMAIHDIVVHGATFQQSISSHKQSCDDEPLDSLIDGDAELDF